MSKDSDKTAYGAKYCLEANANQAIESLLISDKLFRSRNFS
jgi:stalled ribosome rescue protein Dom34